MNFTRQNAVNDVSARNLYSTAQGMTIGMRGSSLTPSQQDLGSESAEITGSGATVAAGSDVTSPGGFIGKPLSWWFVLLLLLVGTMYTAKKLGAGEEFRNLKLSAYNIIVISLAAVVGIGFFKVVFNKFKVPGLTTFVNAV